MRADYVLKRFGIFVLIVWLAGSVNFFLPRVNSQDPIREKLMQQATNGGSMQTGMEEMVAEYDEKFGLNRPVWEQYLFYLGDLMRFDLNYSISNYPRTVTEIVLEAMPWSIGLLAVTTLMAFGLGTLLGAFLGWPLASAYMLLAPRFQPFLTSISWPRAGSSLIVSCFSSRSLIASK